MSQAMIQAGCYQCPPCGSAGAITTVPGPIGPPGEDGEDGAGGGPGSGGIFAVYTFAELKAIPSASTNLKASVSGELAPFVGQFREYMWDNTSGASENIPAVFVPNDSTGLGRWLQVL